MIKRVECFTDPLPDELLSSAVSRYLSQNRSLTHKQVMNELYGVDYARPNPFFASYLDEMSLRLGSEYQSTSLLINHTIFPYFSPFLSRLQKEKIIESITKGSGLVYSLSGLINNSKYGKRATQLRYCPCCYKNDLSKYGFAYFHTLNNLPGIDICPDHLVWLESYRMESWENSRQFIVAEKEKMTELARPCEYPQEIRLAESARQVINNYSIDLSMENIYQKIMNIFQDLHLFNGAQVKWQEVYEILEDYYGEDYLKFKDCFIDSKVSAGKSSNWLQGGFNFKKRSFSPYHSLLLINCFSNDYSSFLSVPEKLIDPKEREWNCINPVCSHFDKSDEIKVSKRGNGRESRIIVSCNSCRMIYTSDLKGQKKPTILQFGKQAINKMQELREKGTSLNKIGDLFKIDPKTVKHHLCYPDSNPIDRRIAQARNELRDLLTQNPGLTRTEAQKLSKSSYNTLFLYDFEWLDLNLPSKREEVGGSLPGSSTQSNDYYNQLEETILLKLKSAYSELLAYRPPIKITKQAFLNYLNISNKFLDKLPKSKEFVYSVKEDKIAFNIRKGILGVDRLIENGERVTRSKLRELGCHKIGIPEVNKAVMEYYYSQLF